MNHQPPQGEDASAHIIECTLIDREARQPGRESAEVFYARLAAECATDDDLEAIIRELRSPHSGSQL